MIDLGLLAIAVARGEELMHAAGALTTVLVFAIWLNRYCERRVDDGRVVLGGLRCSSTRWRQ